MNRTFFLTILFMLIAPIPQAFGEEEVLLDLSEKVESKIEKNNIIEKSEKTKEEQPKKYVHEAIDNTEVEFSIFDSLIDTDKSTEHPFKIEEESLWGKIYKMKVERTSIPTFLLKDELNFKVDKAGIDRLQFYGAYNGSISSLFVGADYDTGYDFNIMEVGVIGDLKDKNTDFKLQLNLKPTNDRSYLQNLFTDVYIMNTRIPHHKVIVGNSRNQVGVDGGASSYTLPFAMRSQIGRTFGNTRALGVRVVGDYPYVDYSLAVNSSDRFFQDFFPGAEFTGWVNVKPLSKVQEKYGNLVVGGGINSGRNHTDYTVAGAYVGYKHKNFFANAEYSIADGYNGVDISTNKASGFYTTLGYKITPKLQILARYDQFDPNRELANDNRREYTVGFNYFIKGQALRLILNYVFCDYENAEDSHRIIMGTQILL